ncbi:hypothetical protein STEG23_014967 [Scotinomys teguina]
MYQSLLCMHFKLGDESCCWNQPNWRELQFRDNSNKPPLNAVGCEELKLILTGKKILPCWLAPSNDKMLHRLLGAKSYQQLHPHVKTLTPVSLNQDHTQMALF